MKRVRPFVLQDHVLRWTVFLTVAVTTGCTPADTPLQRLGEARQLAADLSIQFTKAVDATNRAVMANTAETSLAFAREAEEATQGVQVKADALRPVLEALNYSTEKSLLDEFDSRFSEYRTLDATIRGLAVESTNVKAQRLSFGSSQEAANAIHDALQAVAPLRPVENEWRVKALVATVLAGVREIQALQAPHIAEADDSAMTRLEKRMGAAEGTARSALEALAGLVPSDSRSHLDTATDGFNRFMRLNTEIVELSRRNTNVRSLALSLGQKRMLTAACEESLQQLQEALARRGFGGTR